MLRSAAWWLVVSAALAPGAWLAYRNADMPQLGVYHDDSLYWVTAKALASGEGYRIESLPDRPHQTKYPPLYPALLSLVWRWYPEFPGNLGGAALVAWLLVIPYLAAAHALFRALGSGDRAAWALTAVVAVNPLVATFGVLLMSELLFGALLMAAIVLAERDRPVAGGLVAGLAFLTRTAALPLLFAAPLCFVLRGKRRAAAAFALAMLPAVAGWQAWTWTHAAPSQDLTSLYYTSYLGYHLANVTWGTLPYLAWLNAGAMVTGIGEMLVFLGGDGVLWEQMARLAALGAIAGAVRLTRRTTARIFPIYALLFAAQAVLWHYPPRDRLVLPLLPLAVVGLWTEMAHLGGKIRRSWDGRRAADRVAAVVIGGALAAMAALMAARTVYALGSYLPALIAEQRRTLAAHRPAWDWIARNTPPEARVAAYSDPLVYLHTGRRAASRRIPPRYFYTHDEEGMARFVGGLADFARAGGFSYVLATPADYRLDGQPAGRQALSRALADESDFRPEFQSPGAAVYSVRAK